MKKMMMSCLTLSLAIFGACGAVNAQDTVFKNKEMGFSISLPQGWKQDGKIETEGIAQRLKLVDGKSQLMITIARGPVFEDFKNEVVNNLKQDKINPDPVVEDVDLGGTAALRTVLKLTGENLQEPLPKGVAAVSMEVYFVNGSSAGYIISATTASPDAFDANKAFFENVISTFRIEK